MVKVREDLMILKKQSKHEKKQKKNILESGVMITVKKCNWGDNLSQ